MGELFPRHEYGDVCEENRQMAETADTTDILEAVEKDQHEILCPGQVRQIERASLENREYEKIVLAHCEKSDLVDNSDK